MSRQVRAIISAVFIAIVGIIGYLYEKNSNTEEMGKEAIRIHFIDVGNGDCTLIQLPDDKIMLVDAGEAEEGETVKQYIEKLGVSKIDIMVGTHPHSDHIGGLQKQVESFQVKEIFMPKVLHDSATFENLLECVKERGMDIKVTKAGDVLFDEKGVKVEVVSPVKSSYDNLNNYSVVLKITYNDRKILLTGDAENEVLNSLWVNEKIDLLKVPHHGSSTSDSEMFYDKIKPEYAVISVGEQNQYGHPHREVLGIMGEYNIKCFRTDEEGTIIFETDGKNMKKLGSGEKK